jgi:hypothetical protein
VLSRLAAAAAETGSVTAAPGREVAAVAAMASAERLAYPLQTLYLMVAATVSQGPGFLLHCNTAKGWRSSNASDAGLYHGSNACNFRLPGSRRH